jgi:adenylosuccinate synthase
MPATVLVGGQFGSEGKGKIAAFLAPEYTLAVRTGGPNAGHTVISGEERWVFRHIPCAILNPSCIGVLGAGAVIDCEVLREEIYSLGLSPARLAIDPQACVITGIHRSAEVDLVRTIGSTGKGVGAAVASKVMREDVRLARDESQLAPYLKDTVQLLANALNDDANVLLEGTQGAGLSLYHGHYPHVTSRDVTAGSLCGEAGIGPMSVSEVVLVVRTYPIRVAGPSGPLTSEIDWATVTSESGYQHPLCEYTTVTKKIRRVGRFDPKLVQRAIALNRPTQIALTFVDYLDSRDRGCKRFASLSPASRDFIDELEELCGVRVTLISTGPDTSEIIDRREL